MSSNKKINEKLINNTFSNFLKAERSKRGLTQQEMALFLGFAHCASYTKFEYGTSNSMLNSTLQKFSDGLCVSRIELKKMLKLKYPELTEERFGKLVVIDFVGYKKGNAYWKCRCDCGTEKEISGQALLHKRTISCGCVNKSRQKQITEISKRNFKDGTSIAMIKSTKIPKTNTSGTKGVSWYKAYKKWKVYIEFKGKSYHLGYFENIEDAIAVRRQAEKEYYEPVIKENEIKK